MGERTAADPSDPIERRGTGVHRRTFEAIDLGRVATGAAGGCLCPHLRACFFADVGGGSGPPGAYWPGIRGRDTVDDPVRTHRPFQQLVQVDVADAECLADRGTHVSGLVDPGLEFPRRHARPTRGGGHRSAYAGRNVDGRLPRRAARFVKRRRPVRSSWSLRSFGSGTAEAHGRHLAMQEQLVRRLTDRDSVHVLSSVMVFKPNDTEPAQR